MENYLEFNDKRIELVNADGEWWVAIKPICEALNVNYERQRQNIQEDEILNQLPTVQQVVAADGKRREMVCLPEKFIYGWLFSIRSDSAELKAYKRICYEVLYDHFHGIVKRRAMILEQRTALRIEMSKLEDELQGNEQFEKLQSLRQLQKQLLTNLKDMDSELLKTQMTFKF